MTRSQKPNPHQNICRVTLELPWDIAEALADHGPDILAVIREAVDKRRTIEDRRKEDRVATNKTAESNKLEWSQLAEKCEQEIARRSNGPGQREAILKSLASELGHDYSFLQRICRVLGGKYRKSGLTQRNETIVQMYFEGLSNSEIASKVGLSKGSVSRILTAHKRSQQAKRWDRSPTLPVPGATNGVQP